MNHPASTSPDNPKDALSSTAFIARQPILDRNQQIYGYELLFRTDTTNVATIEDGDAATSRVILNAFVDIGIDRLVGPHLAFFNLTHNLLLQYRDFPFQSAQVGLEILEDVEVDHDLLIAAEELSKQGFTLALDDFFFREKIESLIAIAHIVKVDIKTYAADELKDVVARLRRYQVKLVAEKVETREQYDYCHELGFDYFQGYFLCRPEIVKENTLSDNKLNVLRLLAEIDKPDTGPRELEAIIRNDVSLTYKLLRCVNSAYFGVSIKIESLRHAIVYLGLNTIRNWARMLTLAGLTDRPPELIKLALTRAKMCEMVIANLSRETRETAFTVGLFSLLDALIGVEMKEVLKRVSLSDEITRALLAGAGPYGALLNAVRAYEQADWGALKGSRYTQNALTSAYLDAIAWADEVYMTTSSTT